MQLVVQPCFPPMRSLASFVIFRWGNAFEQKLEVGELRSPASYYTLTTGYQRPSPDILVYVAYWIVQSSVCWVVTWFLWPQ